MEKPDWRSDERYREGWDVDNGYVRDERRDGADMYCTERGCRFCENPE